MEVVCKLAVQCLVFEPWNSRCLPFSFSRRNTTTLSFFTSSVAVLQNCHPIDTPTRNYHTSRQVYVRESFGPQGCKANEPALLHRVYVLGLAYLNRLYSVP